MQADYPTVTTGKKINGGETWGRNLRDEEEGFPQTTRFFCGKHLCRDGFCAVRSEPRKHNCNNLEGSDIECRDDANDAMWHISEARAAYKRNTFVGLPIFGSTARVMLRLHSMQRQC